MIQLNSIMKEQIYSLYLSNKNTYNQIDVFLSTFSLNEFPNLQSLAFTELHHDNVKKLKSMLLLIPRLRSFHVIDCHHDTTALLPTPKVSILTMSELVPLRLDSSIIKLRASQSSLNNLYEIFEYAPMIKYLNLQRICEDYILMDNMYFNTDYVSHLKQLIIGRYSNKFLYFEMFVKQTPYLESLTIFFEYKEDMIEVCRWEQLIQLSLPYLQNFNFIFQCSFTHDKNIIDKFKQFQNDFWHKQHHWYTEYSFNDQFVQIYTIPYFSNVYQLKKPTHRYTSELINHLNIFQNVIYLTLASAVITDKCQYYFSNVKSLTIIPFKYDHNLLHVQFLKIIINLSNLKYLDVSKIWKMLTSSILLEILKESPQLSSLIIDK
ncbi:unnamed protein product, partial [Rotaria sordida]